MARHERDKNAQTVTYVLYRIFIIFKKLYRGRGSWSLLARQYSVRGMLSTSFMCIAFP